MSILLKKVSKLLQVGYFSGLINLDRGGSKIFRNNHTADIDISRGSNIRRKVDGVDERIPGWISWEINENFVDERKRPIDSVICAGCKDCTYGTIGGRGHYAIRAFDRKAEIFRNRQKG